MLSVDLLKSPSFWILALSGFLTMMGFFIPFLYLCKAATLNGIDEVSWQIYPAPIQPTLNTQISPRNLLHWTGQSGSSAGSHWNHEHSRQSLLWLGV